MDIGGIGRIAKFLRSLELLDFRANVLLGQAHSYAASYVLVSVVLYRLLHLPFELLNVFFVLL